MIGTVIAGRYRVDGVVGDTRTARVYRGLDADCRQQVALRMLLGEYASVPKRCLRFAREARIGAMFDHPNVLSVRDSGYTITGLPYIVTEYLDARSLEALIRLEAPFSAERALRVARRICAGLGHIHARGIVHRDLTAANVLLAANIEADEPRITGFRLATFVDDDPTADVADSPERVLGSAAYIAPELLGHQPADGRADLFSLGVILYRLLSGSYPFDGSPLAVAMNNTWDRPPLISERVHGLAVSPGLEAIALRLMAKQPSDRYQTAGDVLAALDEVWDEV